MGAKTKRASVVHKSTEYDLVELVRNLRPPPETTIGGTGWTRGRIRSAREAQQRGRFKEPRALAAAMQADDGLYAALRNRISPTGSLPVALDPANTSARARRICDEAVGLFGQNGIAIRPETVSNWHEDLAQHQIAIGTCAMTPRQDGSRVDTCASYWPLQHVWWDAQERELKTRTEDFGEEVIRHGDGRWIVIRGADDEPWKRGAVVPASGVWQDRQFGKADRQKASVSHGNAKMIGELPEGVSINSDDGRALLRLMEAMHEALPFGVRPHGSKTEMLVNNSTAWQIFQEIVKGGLGDGARIYLGHDGSTSAVGGNYIKDGLLYGVTVNIVEGDLAAMTRGIFEGVIVPWTAINFGDSSLAPQRSYMMPDADADARDDSMIKRRKAMFEDLAQARAGGIVVDQEYVNAIAKTFRLDPPQLADAQPSGADFLIGEIEAGIWTIDEVRERKGVGPMPNGMGAITVPSARVRDAATVSLPGTAPSSAPAGQP